MLRIAADLDADFVLFGKFNSDGKSLAIEVRLLRVNPTSLAASNSTERAARISNGIARNVGLEVARGQR